MDTVASSFDTSEIAASFVTSTPLLSESWRLCNLANTTFLRSFVTEHVGNVGYVAFSGVQEAQGLDSSSLVALDCPMTEGHFLPLTKTFSGQQTNGKVERDPPAMVPAGMLNLFMSFYTQPNFRNQMSILLQNCKSIVMTGHSLGGTIASLIALWLLSDLQTKFSSISVLCITFGSPLLGNETLNRAILRERWGGNFCHVVLRHDLMPRLLFAPHHTTQFLMALLHFGVATIQYPAEDIARQFQSVLSYTKMAAQAEEGSRGQPFCPFGNYLFCSDEGAICVDNASSVIKMLHWMLETSSPISSIKDHFKYGDHVEKLFLQCLTRRGPKEGNLTESSYEASVALALQSSEAYNQGFISENIKDCLTMASRKRKQSPNQVSANLAIRLAKVTPYRAEIEWYKLSCDNSADQLGYYDSFKRRGATKREFKVNMNRFKLAALWDDVLRMMEENELPADFLSRDKWVNAAHFYKLLVEPLDIAEYYRTSEHQRKGHYMQNGRARRYQMFDRWWKQTGDKKNYKRTKFASLTQDSCFWAKVEEARNWLDTVRTDPMNLDKLWGKLIDFEKYATNLVDSKVVSQDVVAKNSSYSLWLADWRALKLQFQQQPESSFPLDEGSIKERIQSQYE